MTTRPLRSLLIGDVDYYPSEFIFGVQQGMTLLGHWHSTVNIRQDAGVILKRLREVQPDIVWGHMLFWPPGKQSDYFYTLMSRERRRGAKVVIHDGDAKSQTRFSQDLSDAVDLALCNHTAPRLEWNVRCLRWPYFAFVQERFAAPVPEFACELAFAGRMDSTGIYAERTAFVQALKEKLGDRMRVFSPSLDDQHTLFRTPELAASAAAVLGWGRPDAPGWTDVRTFQYPGAGGVLLSNGASEWLDHDLHYICIEPNVDSVLTALARVVRDHRLRYAIRLAAFDFVQRKHSSTARVQQVLTELGLT